MRIGTYFQMVADMFFYAGNSNDGHTIGNMVVINFKGTVRGILLLAVLYVIYLVAKKVKSLAPLIGYGMIAVAVLLLAGAVSGQIRSQDYRCCIACLRLPERSSCDKGDALCMCCSDFKRQRGFGRI